MKRQYIFGHTNEENAYLVDDYPYGFRLRTQIRYWMETTKYGDRFCSQTLNPKTGRWNKPKKSTYSAVGVMFLNEDNHVKWTGFSLGWTNEEKIRAFVEMIGGIEKLNEAQVSKVKEGIAISRTQENITYEIKPSSTGPVSLLDESPENKAKLEQLKREEEEREAEQKETTKNINKLYAYHRATVKV